MLPLEHITKNAAVAGIAPGQVVRIVTTEPVGDQALTVYYKTADGVLHEREEIKIHEIGINMGLNPHAIKRVLKAMETSPTKMISPDFLLEVFHEQLN